MSTIRNQYELDFNLSAPIMYAKAKFNPIILPKVIEYTTYRQTDRYFHKNLFF